MRNILSCFIVFSVLLASCKKAENKEYIRKENKASFYIINLPDTISSGVPYLFDIKLSYPTNVKNENFFSYLILSDSVEITLDNIMRKKDNPYEILEVSTNHWSIRRTFYKKGNFIVKGGIIVRTLEFKNPKNDSIQMFEHEGIIPIKRKIYVK